MPNSVWDAIHKTCDAIRELPDADAPSELFARLGIDRGRYDATLPIRSKLNEVIEFLEPYESVDPAEFPALPTAIAESVVTQLNVIAGIAKKVRTKCNRWPETTGTIPPSFAYGEINACTRTIDVMYAEICVQFKALGVLPIRRKQTSDDPTKVQDVDVKVEGVVSGNRVLTAVNRPLLLSLHGIRTSILKPGWQEELGNLIDREKRHYESVAYGFLPAVLFLIPWVRKRRLEWFYKRWEAAKNNFKVVPSIVAHSFGTHLVAAAMRKYPDMKFDRMVFCGSIVKTDFKWKGISDRGQFTQLLNQYGGVDFWAGFVQWAVTDAGPSGKRGFDKNPELDGILVQEEYPEWDHGNYFHRTNYKRWLTFVAGEELPDYKPVHDSGRPNYRPLFVLFALVVGSILLFRWCGRTHNNPVPIPPTPWTTAMPSSTASGIKETPPSPLPLIIAESTTPSVPSPSSSQTSTASSTPTPAVSISSTPDPVISQASDALVDQGLLHLKQGRWPNAIQAFDQALKVHPGNILASNALWKALVEYSAGRLDLPDRAYAWPEGAGLKALACNDPFALILPKPPPQSPLALYNYQSGKQVPVFAAPLSTNFCGTGRLLFTWQEKIGQQVTAFNETGTWPFSLPNSWSYFAGRKNGDFLLYGKDGQFRWWNPIAARWTEAPGFKIPGFSRMYSIGGDGHYLLWQGSKTTDIHIQDLIAQKEILSPIRFSMRLQLSATNNVLVVTESLLTQALRNELAQVFTLWIVPEPNPQEFQYGNISASGDFLLESNQRGEIFVRQRKSGRLYRMGEQSTRFSLARPWLLHPILDELYFQAGRSLCVYTLPTMAYFESNEAPSPPSKPPGQSIHRFLNLVRSETAVNLCHERDELHAALVKDTASTDRKGFSDLPDEWRQLLIWWTARPGERKPW